jgi:hypothetical protein
VVWVGKKPGGVWWLVGVEWLSNLFNVGFLFLDIG